MFSKEDGERAQKMCERITNSTSTTMKYTLEDMENAFEAGRFAGNFIKWMSGYQPVSGTPESKYSVGTDPYWKEGSGVSIFTTKKEDGTVVARYIGRPDNKEDVAKEVEKIAGHYNLSVIKEKDWWNTCTRMALVEYGYTSPFQVRVWAGYGTPDETPQNTFKGQFWANDIRVTTLQDKLSPDSINTIIWSPVMDGGWDQKDTQPLLEKL